MQNNKVMHHCSQRAELLLEHNSSQPIFYCQDLEEEAIRKCTCAFLILFGWLVFERKMADDSLQNVYLDSDFSLLTCLLAHRFPWKVQFRGRNYTVKDF